MPPVHRPANPATIVPIFATPFAVVGVAEALPDLGPAAAIIVARATGAVSAPGTRIPRAHEGECGLDAAPLARVQRAALASLQSVVAMLNDGEASALAAMTLETRVRFAVVNRDGHLPARTIPRASWCALLCLEAPPAAAERADSGALRLLESRLGTMFTDASNADMSIPYRAGHYTWLPVAGQMAVFPASVPHEIATLRSPGRLVALWIHARFVAPGKQSLGAW